MSRAIDKVRSAYTAARRSMVVPEWDDLELHFSRLTTADLQAITAREPKDGLDQDLLLLIHKAMDAEGKPLFQFGDLTYLRTEADYLVVRRVIAFMYDSTQLARLDGAVTQAEQQEAATAIAQDPSSASA